MKRFGSLCGFRLHPTYEDLVNCWTPDGDGKPCLTYSMFFEAFEAAGAEKALPFLVIIEETNVDRRNNCARSIDPKETIMNTASDNAEN